jgi:UDP-2,3-diacylglucosamine pyrophosphatase LpxH
VLMGHTHTPEVRDLADGARYVNMGSWLQGGRPWARYEAGELEVTAPDGSVTVLPVPVRGA